MHILLKGYFILAVILAIYRCRFNEGDRIVSNQLIDNVGNSLAHK